MTPVSAQSAGRRIFFATSAEHAEITYDDRFAANALAEIGVDAVPLVWSAEQARLPLLFGRGGSYRRHYLSP